MSDFYEQALVTAGVAIEKDVTAERLWGLEERVRGQQGGCSYIGESHPVVPSTP